LGGFGNTLDGSRVLGGEKALGDEDVEQHGEGQGAQGHPQGGFLPVQHPGEHAPVSRDHPVNNPAAGVVEAPLFFLRHMAQELGAEHGGEGQRHHSGNQDGHRQGNGEFPEQTPHHVPHEKQGNEHGHQGKGQGNDGEADLGRALEGGLEGGFPVFQVTGDVFDDHDGVIHHKAGGNGEGHEGQVIDRKTGQIHDSEGAHQGEGHGKTGDQGGRQIAQEQENHHHHQGDGK